MIALLLTMSVALVPSGPVVLDTVDMIEWNHFYNEQGELVFEQVIFWRYYQPSGELHVAAWRLVKSRAQIPLPDRQRKGYVSIWHDGSVLRKVRSRRARQTWTQYDPELLDRQWVKPPQRYGLTGVAVPGEQSPQSAADGS